MKQTKCKECGLLDGAHKMDCSTGYSIPRAERGKLPKLVHLEGWKSDGRLA